MREVDFTKKRLQQEFEDRLEVEQQNKRQLERRVSLLEAMEACAGEELGGAWRHMSASEWPVNGQRRQALGAVGEGWHVCLWMQGTARATLFFKCLSSPDVPELHPSSLGLPLTHPSPSSYLLPQYSRASQWPLTLYPISAPSSGTCRQIVRRARGLCSNSRRSASG